MKAGRFSYPTRTGPTNYNFDPKRPAPPIGSRTSVAGAAEDVFMEGRAPTASLSIIASRTTGVAPLGVFFEAEVSGGGLGVDYPFHELRYVWDFDETGTWGYGNTLRTSKGAAEGPVAAHVFSESGAGGTSHDVTCTVYRRVGGVTSQIATDTVTVTTTSAFTEFNVAGKIVLYGTGASTTGVATYTNATARDVNTLTAASVGTDIGNGVRAFLFQRGQTYTITSGAANFLNGNTDPKIVGAWGAGAKPILIADDATALFHASNEGGDLRILGVELQNQTGSVPSGPAVRLRSKVTNVLVQDVNFGLCGYGFYGEATQQNVGSPGENSDLLFLNGCVFASATSHADRNSPLYFSGTRVSVQGCDIDMTGHLSGRHSYRMYHSQKVVCSHNRFVGTSLAASAFNDIKFSPPGTLSPWNAGAWQEKVLIQDNEFTGTRNAECITVGPQSGSAGADAERVRDVILEGNYFHDAEATLQVPLEIEAPLVTVRNNIVEHGTSTTAGRLAGVDTQGNPNGADIENVWIYNNSMENGAASSSAAVTVASGVSGRVEISNNIYFHSGSASAFVSDSGPDTVESNNLLTTSTPYASATPGTETDFRVAGGAAEGAGAEVAGLFNDYEGTDVTAGSVNQGAFQDQT